MTIRKYKTSTEGITDISEILKVDITSVDPAKIILSGDYDVLIPNFVNDAAVGIVTLSGEVMRPGEYIISRNETLKELLTRAGGFTAVAYPLGMTLNRETLKISGTESKFSAGTKVRSNTDVCTERYVNGCCRTAASYIILRKPIKVASCKRTFNNKLHWLFKLQRNDA